MPARGYPTREVITMPPMPKRNPARRNKSTTQATLTRDHDVKAPALPRRARGKTPWHTQTKAWWAEIWSSPMAPEFEHSDTHGLFILAELVDAFWHEPSKELASEIRLQRMAFGLTPLDRRRLQWEIEHTEDAQERGRKRRAAAEPPVVDPAADPRSKLNLVS